MACDHLHIALQPGAALLFHIPSRDRTHPQLQLSQVRVDLHPVLVVLERGLPRNQLLARLLVHQPRHLVTNCCIGGGPGRFKNGRLSPLLPARLAPFLILHLFFPLLPERFGPHPDVFPLHTGLQPQPRLGLAHIHFSVRARESRPKSHVPPAKLHRILVVQPETVDGALVEHGIIADERRVPLGAKRHLLERKDSNDENSINAATRIRHQN